MILIYQLLNLAMKSLAIDWYQLQNISLVQSSINRCREGSPCWLIQRILEKVFLILTTFSKKEGKKEKIRNIQKPHYQGKIFNFALVSFRELPC